MLLCLRCIDAIHSMHLNARADPGERHHLDSERNPLSLVTAGILLLLPTTTVQSVFWPRVGRLRLVFFDRSPYLYPDPSLENADIVEDMKSPVANQPAYSGKAPISHGPLRTPCLAAPLL